MTEKVFLLVSSVASYTIPEFIVPISRIMRIKNSKIMNMDAYDFGLSGIFPHRASQFMTPFRHRICGEKNFTASRSSKFLSHRGCKCWYTVRVCMCALFLTLFVSETGLHSLYKKSWWPCAQQWIPVGDVYLACQRSITTLHRVFTKTSELFRGVPTRADRSPSFAYPPQ